MSNEPWYNAAAASPDVEARRLAEARQAILTKPPGALGRLESLAIRLAGLQGRVDPSMEQIDIAVFVADHGIVDEGISAFPQVVTFEMIRNFVNGGAAINVLARSLGAQLSVVNLGTVVDETLPGVIDARIAPGTANFAVTTAMTEAQFEQAMDAGRAQVRIAADLFIGGEMGIGNTTSAAAVCCALLDIPPTDMAGPGTGLDADGVSHKAQVIEQALALHAQSMKGVTGVLRWVGGFEIAALTGAYIACAQQRIPVLVDGFISSTAALCANHLCSGASDWFFYSHRSAEPGHRHILEALDADPVLDLGMRLGEGSGAAVTAAILRQACALHNEMATFAEAGIPDGQA